MSCFSAVLGDERQSQWGKLLDVAPEGDYEGIRDQLELWESEGLLEYETCEARVDGTFDGRGE
jgi:hypothetical protein